MLNDALSEMKQLIIHLNEKTATNKTYFLSTLKPPTKLTCRWFLHL